MQVRFAFLRPGKIAKTLTAVVRDILNDIQAGKSRAHVVVPPIGEKGETARDPHKG